MLNCVVMGTKKLVIDRDCKHDPIVQLSLYIIAYIRLHAKLFPDDFVQDSFFLFNAFSGFDP